VPFEGVAGECTAYDNTATIVETGQSDSAQVEVCVGVDLEVSNNVVQSQTRTYLWDIDKEATETEVVADGDGNATFGDTVTATPTGSQDSGWLMSGQITVENPNLWQSVVADVTDTVDIGGGASCEVTGGSGAEVPAATRNGDAVVPGTLVLDYHCTFASKPAYD